MKRLLIALAGLLVALGAYLSFWPVPIDPVAWQAPTSRGYIDPFSRNSLLKPATAIELGDFEGPEDAAVGNDGLIYVTTETAKIIRVRNRAVDEFAAVGGRPLGIETAADGSLIIANAVSGIQRVAADGSVSVILDQIESTPLVNANNLGIAPDGTIYFSQSSTRFTAADFGGSYQASLLDIMEHGGRGNVYSFDPATGAVARLLTGLNYANGVAVSSDGSYLLVAETGHYRILKHWLSGDTAGQTEVLLDNLPGFPDNIKNGFNDRFWIGFAAPRNTLLDKLSDQPFLRKVVQRLPAAIRPKAVPSSHVIAIDGDGHVLMNLHEPAARFPTLTGVLETRDALYLTTLFGRQLPRINKRDLYTQ